MYEYSLVKKYNNEVIRVLTARTDVEALNSVTSDFDMKVSYLRNYPHPSLDGVIVIDFGLHNIVLHRRVISSE